MRRMADQGSDTGAACPDIRAERWASSPAVQRMLANMLAFPFADHRAAVAVALDGRQLTELHAYGL